MIATQVPRLKRCPTCGEDLTMDYFRQRGRQCDSCADAADAMKPWAVEDIERVRLAVRGVNDYYVAHWDHMSEPERKRFRELTNAMDRRKSWDSP